MKTMIYSLALTALLLPLGSCSDDDSPVLTQKDWDGTATYFASTDEMTFATIISRTWDMWATRCRSMIRWHRISRCYIFRIFVRIQKLTIPSGE